MASKYHIINEFQEIAREIQDYNLKEMSKELLLEVIEDIRTQLWNCYNNYKED